MGECAGCGRQQVIFPLGVMASFEEARAALVARAPSPADREA
jgi:hypothetical protein